MDRSMFYAALRKKDSGVFGTSLKQSQIDGIEAVLDEAEKRETPLTHLSYMLATDYHETARTMQPIAEYGKGKGRPYGKPGKYHQVPYGRGLVQLTWDENYELADKKLGLKGALLKNFDLAMNMSNAVPIMFDGMKEGWFTKKKLSDFLTPTKTDYEGSRRIINGVDKKVLIAGYARAFEKALRAADYEYDFATTGKPAAPVVAGKTDKTTVEVVQSKLWDLGYTEVGSRDPKTGRFDGKIGKLTKTAILAFRNENDLPVTDIIDDQLLEALDDAPARNLARNDANPAKARAAAPEIQSNFVNKVAAAGGAGLMSTGAVGSALSKVEDVRGYIQPWKDMLTDIPAWAWFGVGALALVGVYLVARRGELKGVEAYQNGERR